TRHLTLFTLMRDIEAPSPPTQFAGVVGDDGLTLRWAPGAENTGLLNQFTLFVDGQPYANYDVGQLETKLGAFTADDTREFTIVESDLSGNVSAPAGPLTAVPDVVGMSLDDATAALAARGFTTGTLTPVAATVPAGTVVGPTGVQVLQKGSAVDLQVSGTVVPRQTQLVFAVAGASKVALTQRTIAARVKISKPAALTVRLLSPRKQLVQTWRLRVKAGATIVKLRLRSAHLSPGVYSLVWFARSGSETTTYTQRIRIGADGRRPTQADVVLTLKSAPSRQPQSHSAVRHLFAGDVDSTFALAAGGNVQVVVVDVDRYGVLLVRDLRVVFPSVRV